MDHEVWPLLGNNKSYHVSVDDGPQSVDVHVLEELLKVFDGTGGLDLEVFKRFVSCSIVLLFNGRGRGSGTRALPSVLVLVRAGRQLLLLALDTISYGPRAHQTKALPQYPCNKYNFNDTKVAEQSDC